MAERFPTPEPVQFTDVSLMGPKGGFLREPYVLTNDPNYPQNSVEYWMDTSEMDTPKMDTPKMDTSKRARSESTSSTSPSKSPSTSPSKSPSTSPAKKSQKTSSTSSRPRASDIGSQPSTSRASDSSQDQTGFDPSSIHKEFRKYCAVVNSIYEGRKYWQMKLTLKPSTTGGKDAEVRTLCEVGFAPTYKTYTDSKSLAYPHGDIFTVKIGKSKTHWRALWGYRRVVRDWEDIHKAIQNESNEYSLSFGIFLDSPCKKITFYTVCNGDSKVVWTETIDHSEGYPIFSLGESEMSHIATVLLEMEHPKRLSIIDEQADVNREKIDPTPKPKKIMIDGQEY